MNSSHFRIEAAVAFAVSGPTYEATSSPKRSAMKIPEMGSPPVCRPYSACIDRALSKRIGRGVVASVSERRLRKRSKAHPCAPHERQGNGKQDRELKGRNLHVAHQKRGLDCIDRGTLKVEPRCPGCSSARNRAVGILSEAIALSG